jgi:hypothetical protein
MSRTEQPEGAWRAEFDPENGLARRQHARDHTGRMVSGSYAQLFPQRLQICGAAQVGGTIRGGQIGKAERHVSAGVRADVAKLIDVDRLVRGQVRDSDHQPRIDLAGQDLPPGQRRDGYLFDLQHGGFGRFLVEPVL